MASMPRMQDVIVFGEERSDSSYLTLKEDFSLISGGHPIDRIYEYGLDSGLRTP